MSYYPVEYFLKDGTAVFIRLLTKDDKEGLKTGFGKLSVHSQYCRFFSPIGHLSQSQLDYLTEIDNINHLALCVGIDDADNTDHPTGIGIGRYIRSKENPASAEIAITVIDEYQNLGLGTKLLELLIEAALRNGINTFTGDVLKENEPMLEILKKYNCVFNREEGLITKVELSLSENVIPTFRRNPFGKSGNLKEKML
jgi:GNAT superfamily N-acetyltransferase